jgi:hypothetical protein
MVELTSWELGFGLEMIRLRRGLRRDRQNGFVFLRARWLMVKKPFVCRHFDFWQMGSFGNFSFEGKVLPQRHRVHRGEK